VTFSVPPEVLKFAASGPGWESWVRRLPGLAASILEEWDLVVDGEPTSGWTALVLPVRAADGAPAVLKLRGPGEEGADEHLALQRWGGDGAVRLIRADPARRVLLLERLHSRDLTEVGIAEACEVVASLYSRIHVPALPQLRTQTSFVREWLDGLAALPRESPVPHRMVEQALSLGRDLVADPASTGTMVHGDLHYENVLAGDRAPWLVIDPEPTSGDPHFEPAPLLWNRWDEIADEAATTRDAVRRRFHTVVDAAGLDEQRAVAWVVVRMVVNAFWSIEDAEREARPLGPEELEWITRCVVIAKAVQE
jgi:streptomycin 6-kinase